MSPFNTPRDRVFCFLGAIMLFGLLGACGPKDTRSSGSTATTTTALSASWMARRVTAYVIPSTPSERLESVVKGLEVEAKILRAAGLNGMTIDQENSAVTFYFDETTNDKVLAVLSMLKAQVEVVCVIEAPGGELTFGSGLSLQERRSSGETCTQGVSG